MRNLQSSGRLIESAARRRFDSGAARIVLLALGLALAGAMGGCPQQQQQQQQQQQSQNPTPDSGDNSRPATASNLSIAADGTLSFDAAISSASDVDVFKLGTLNPGDRVVVDAKSGSAALDLVMGVFDGKSNIHAFNDDRVADSSDLNPLIDFIIRGPTQEYFLAIQEIDGGSASGSYSVSLKITPGVGVPATITQLVLLNWQGGSNVRVPNVGVFNLPPFDAAQVGLNSAITTELKRRVQAIIEDRYKGFNLIVLNTDDDGIPNDAHSTVYYGSNSATAFAISEQIDLYDADHADDCIVFTGAFRDAFAAAKPTFEEMAQALGNTTAHEIGHLLGLVHTKSCNDLMDTTCGNARILKPQAFTAAPLDISVFAFGTQNEPQLLEWTLGLSN